MDNHHFPSQNPYPYGTTYGYPPPNSQPPPHHHHHHHQHHNPYPPPHQPYPPPPQQQPYPYPPTLTSQYPPSAPALNPYPHYAPQRPSFSGSAYSSPPPAFSHEPPPPPPPHSYSGPPSGSAYLSAPPAFSHESSPPPPPSYSSPPIGSAYSSAPPEFSHEPSRPQPPSYSGPPSGSAYSTAPPAFSHEPSPPPPHSYSGLPSGSAYPSVPSAPPAFSHEPSPSPPPHEYDHHMLSHSSSFSYSNHGYPVLGQQNSLKYGSTHTSPDSLHRRNSSVPLFSSSVNYGDGKIQSYPSVYPPIDHLLENVHLSSNEPSPSVSEPKPSGKYHSGPLPGGTGYNSQGSLYGHHNHSHSFSSQGMKYGFANSSFSSYESSPSRFQSSSSPSPNRLSLDIPNSQALHIVPVSPKGSLKVLLLHGNLDIWVCEAKNLPNMDMFHKTLGDMFNKLPGNMTSKIEGRMNHKITSDPYVTITLCDAAVARTYVISNDENPVWMQHFNVPVAHYAAEILFLVKDNDIVGSQLIGTVAIPVENISRCEKIDGFFPILGPNGKPCKPGAVLRVSIQFAPIEKLSIYHSGVGAGPDYTGVPGTYFPLRKGGRVTLYQDAHVPDGYLPSVKLGYGIDYVHGKCWHDIFDSIRQARRLIYITGWSVWHKVKLIRDQDPVSGYSLGELLKAKSQEGVRVLLLVWDDPTSRSILGYRTDGLMATHDEETRRFFKHSSVQVLLCPRVGGKRTSWYKQTEVGVIYTHHQKTVIVDADAGNNLRRIVAFVGGLDLCDGRYDTPNHTLFRTLETLHADDYHNPTFAGNTAGCPREPWHDLHCKIDGPAAYDVLENFEKRWLKASKPHGIKKLKGSNDDSLLRIERMSDILGAADAPCLTENDPECWHVQVFRSIDSNSVKGFPKDPKKATLENLMCGKNVLIDMSIHTAYVKAIRAAQHFIYIENQYFIGSSYNWGTYKAVGANNLIPMEIALKIAEKIRARERFAVYIVVPMWPEGNPTGAAMQRILFWQHKTMQMMYETIYKALVEMGLEDTFIPEDYLNFFCLGNREALDSTTGTTNYAAPVETQGTSPNTPQALSRKNRRFMIYVHSKGMIVDDEYVILGSANINQRSMEGSRDTEIAMGGYQPHHTWARHSASPRGQIYGYRMSLWAEHLGVLVDGFMQPDSLECVRRVRSMGEMNWKQFASPEITEMRGHLCKYPVEVDRIGKVKPLPGHETFPDVGGSVVGSFLAIQENLTI